MILRIQAADGSLLPVRISPPSNQPSYPIYRYLSQWLKLEDIGSLATTPLAHSRLNLIDAIRRR
ncbi:hypothetical protein BJX65DRAFT_87212 [Aspergillus insuetus]